MIEFKLPSLGSDMDKGKLLEWKVKPGDRVKKGDVVAIVDTSKAAVEIEIWDEGTVHELVVQPQDTIPVGTLMAVLLAPGESADAAVSVRRQAPRSAPVAAAERRRISPAARKRAEELGLDIGAVAGTGPDGAVTLQDVEAAGAKKPAAASDKPGEMRRAIAAAMSRSKREIPHYYLSEAIPLARAMAWLAAENAKRPVTERLLMAALFLKAVALACSNHADMNGHFKDGGFQPSATVHVGVAISLRDGGLIAPAILDAGARSLPELMRGLADLVKRARAGSLRSSEMSGPTITVTNLGDQGVDSVHGVIYPPQVALVGFGRVAVRPWIEAGEIRAVPMVTASLSADHRVSNGHRGTLFLAEVGRLLQEPEAL